MVLVMVALGTLHYRTRDHLRTASKARVLSDPEAIVLEAQEEAVPMLVHETTMVLLRLVLDLCLLGVEGEAKMEEAT